MRDTARMERPDRFDPYRVLGVPPGAPLDEVKAAYRRLAKRHHPDAAGPGQLARFLTVQAAYETIARSRGSAVRGQGSAARSPGPAARGTQRDAGRDWYAAAREAARARSRAGRGHGTGPRARSGGAAGSPGTGAAGTGPGGAPHAGSRPAGAQQEGARHSGRSGRPQEDGRRDHVWRRRATLGSTTYDDAVEEPPAWDGSAWYGAASGTYWTVNPREYADPRKHGPEYLGRATEWTGDRPAAASTDARVPGPAAAAGGAARTRGPAADRASPPAPEQGDRRTAPGGARDSRATMGSPAAPVGPRGRPAGIAATIRALLGGRGRRDPRVG